MSSPLYLMVVGGNPTSKGADAMMLTVRDAVRSALPQAVCCVTPRTPFERRHVEAQGFRTITRHLSSRPVRLAQSGLMMLGLLPGRRVDPSAVSAGGIFNPFRCTSAVVDIAGFSSSDQFGPKAALNRWRRYRAAGAAGNRIVFMPQSWGPFENRWVRLFTRRMLSKAEVIFAREKLSYEYLMTLPGLDHGRILLSPDIAFQFHGSSPEAADRILVERGLGDQAAPLVGIAPNMRIYERTPHEGADNPYMNALIRIARDFIERADCHIVLLPHEGSKLRPNDPELCRMLADHVDCPGRVVGLTGEESSADMKAVIGRLEFLVTSRYHALVAALSLRVPTAVLGWSHKYDELMGAVGIEKWLIDPVRRPEAFDPAIIMDAWEQRGVIRAAEEARVPELESASRAGLERLIGVVAAAGSEHD